MTNGTTMSWLEQNAAYSWESGVACEVNLTLAGNATLVGVEEPASTMWVGILLSVLADTFIAVSLAVQKLAHNRNANPETGKPMKPFIKLPLWWAGITMNGGGEIGNMLAYAFAPAAIVAPGAADCPYGALPCRLRCNTLEPPWSPDSNLSFVVFLPTSRLGGRGGERDHRGVLPQGAAAEA